MKATAMTLVSAILEFMFPKPTLIELPEQAGGIPVYWIWQTLPNENDHIKSPNKIEET
jgi:hypothetical protein